MSALSSLADPPPGPGLGGFSHAIDEMVEPPGHFDAFPLRHEADYGRSSAAETAGEDPFDDFEDDDFDDEFDDDFEEDWEDDLTEDEEFPDTFGGEEDEDADEVEIEDDDSSPFSDDPDFDED